MLVVSVLVFLIIIGMFLVLMMVIILRRLLLVLIMIGLAHVCAFLFSLGGVCWKSVLVKLICLGLPFC